MDVRFLGSVDYASTYAAMQEFTNLRAAQSSQEVQDQLWICEHPAVYTQGLAGKSEHVLSPGAIPVVQTNRGGQITYHGPGQVVAYPLIDLKRAGYFIKEYVYRIEEAVIKTLAHLAITGHRVSGAPGIYVRLDDPAGHQPLANRPVRKAASLTPAAPAEPDFTGLGKIAALGVKVSRHCTYHGVALNVAMDLEPFSRINPCGYTRLQTVDLSTIGVTIGQDEAARLFADKLCTYLTP